MRRRGEQEGEQADARCSPSRRKDAANRIRGNGCFRDLAGRCKWMCDGGFSSLARVRRVLPTARRRHGHCRASGVTVA